MLRYLIISFLLLSYSEMAIGQMVKLDGKTISASEVVPYASISVKDNEGNILKYTQSDNEGKFTVEIESKIFLSVSTIEVRCLGYHMASIAVKKEVLNYEISLQKRENLIDEVLVKKRVIEQRNDTLAFDVGTFVMEGDRSIGDVIKRMPGMEVSPDGKVSYNGQDISHLYIDGDDLLEDRYAIGTRAIPYDMVNKLEVLKNHEPIKLLKDKTFSNRVAINLSLKDDAKIQTSSEFRLGAGIKDLFDGTWNGLIFNKKLKTLNSIRANNSGTDLRNDFKEFNFSNSTFASEILANEKFLNARTVSEPWLEYKRYYDNRSGSANINYLRNLKKDWQLRSSAVFWSDKNIFRYANERRYLLSDTTTYIEDQKITGKPLKSAASISLIHNGSQFFFDNKTRITYSRIHDQSNLTFNNNPLYQGLVSHSYTLSNASKYLKKLRDNSIVDFQHTFVLHVAPQVLISESLPSPTESTDESINHQQYRNPIWSNQLAIKYRFPDEHRIRHAYSLRVDNERQALTSALQNRVSMDNHWEDVSRNALAWTKHRIALDPEFGLDIKDSRTVVYLPLIFQKIQYKDDLFALKNSLSDLFFEPSVSSRYKVNNDEIVLNYGYKRTFGNIYDLYQGNVMNSFNRFSSNIGEFPEGGSLSGELRYHFSRPIRFLLGNIALSHHTYYSNTIVSQRLDNNFIQNILVSSPNRNSRIGLSANISKYLPNLRTTLKLRPAYFYRHINSSFDNIIYKANIDEYSLGSHMEFPIFKKVQIAWVGKQKFMVTYPDGRSLLESENQVDISYPLSSYLFLKSSLNHTYFKQNNFLSRSYLFFDFLARYRFPKNKMELEISAVNLGNIQQYQSIYIDAFSWSRSVYRLRDRMILASISFHLP